MSPSDTLLEQLVALAIESCDPAEAQRAGRRALFDHLACLTAGRRVVPAGVQDAGAAAALDRDDVHWRSLTHPGAVIWSVLRSLDADSPELWRAAHAGYEVTARLGVALGASHRRFWHASSTAGSVGGAVAAALLIGVDPVDAASHAVSLAGGSILCILQRTGTRIVHRDNAAATALRCARLAPLRAARDCLEHPQGMFAAMGGSPEVLLEPRERAALSEASFRRHATSGFSQALVEAAMELAPVRAPEPVLVEAPAQTLALAGIAEPADAEQAWWSCQHAVAVTLLGLDLEDAALVDDPGVAALRSQVRVQVADCSRVSVAARSAERMQAAALGDAELLEKWRRLNSASSPPVELLDLPPA